MNTNHRRKGSFVASEASKLAPHSAPATSIQHLLDIMASLRAPDGCPWDQAQSFESLIPFLQEESAEYIDAVRENDTDGMREELGDVLLQVVFHAEIAREKGLFDFQDVVDGISEKLWTRHPHVFGDHEKLESPEDVETVWAQRKAAEKAEAGVKDDAYANPLLKVPRSLEPLVRAQELGRRAAKVGFDWGTPERVIEKIHEELAELEEAFEAKESDGVHEEIGDLLMAITQLARKLELRSDEMLARCNRKFEKRFTYVAEAMAAAGVPLEAEQFEAMQRFWDEARAKRVEEN